MASNGFPFIPDLEFLVFEVDLLETSAAVTQPEAVSQLEFLEFIAWKRQMQTLHSFFVGVERLVSGWPQSDPARNQLNLMGYIIIITNKSNSDDIS